VIFSYTADGNRDPFDPLTTGACLAGCILCGRRVKAVGIFVPLTDEMREVLGTRFIEELLALVDDGRHFEGAHLEADRERLTREISNLMDLAASGVPIETVAPKIRERQTALARVEAQLRVPRQAPPNIEKLRAALEQRAELWKAELRAEPKVARLLLRRLVGPLTLWDEADAELRWDAPVSTALLDGIVQDVASPTGFEPVF
jgi:hypothetical protein